VFFILFFTIVLAEMFKYGFETASMKKLHYCLLIFLKAARAVVKEFPKAAGNHVNGFSKASGNFMKKSAKKCQLQRLSETLLYRY
jgi:hypothetical protein